ncbi:tripartite tricarboxylate transporter substrate binding protein [Aquincola sp. MAHUQ-54]|uniref:Tripartite tricarboxylate transporter substrate binding protein n=1 Tax=Aquincola agrisoli TaxID=3119538 RepID=A0AAW9Q4E0_9BURK
MKKLLALLLAAACAAPATGWAQAYPSKMIRLVVPYPAGGTTDIMARVLQEPLQKALGQTVLVENKPGAAGALGAREVARAPADGHTLFFVNNGILSVTPQVVKSAGFDGVKDFAPVALVSTAPMFVVVNGSVPATDVRSYVEYVKKQPQPVAYASAGIGSFGHLTSELFARTAGLKMTHIPYKGQAATTNAVVSGEVGLLVTTASAAMNEFIASGRLHLLGVTSPEPSPLAPGVPTVGATLPGFTAESWFAILAPAGTPPQVVARLNAVINETLGHEDIQRRFLGFGVVATTATPRRLADMVAEDVARWAPVIRERAISTE